MAEEAIGGRLSFRSFLGLVEQDFDFALRGLLGENAPFSATTVARLKEARKVDYYSWATPPLSGGAGGHLWVDAVYVKAGLEKAKAALLVAIGNPLKTGRSCCGTCGIGRRLPRPLSKPTFGV